MKELSIDIETYSREDLTKVGVYRYSEAPDFKILLFAYAFDDGDIKIIDFTSGETPPNVVMQALQDVSIRKTAYNANFERTCIARYFDIPMPPEQWQCSAVMAAELGLPQTLSGVAQALNLGQKKDTRGKALINYFSKPCKPTKSNGERTRNLPKHDPEKWQMFKDYCIQDVAVEREIKKKLKKFPLRESEQRLWEIDQRILDRGVGVHQGLVQNAIQFDEWHKKACKAHLQAITHLDNVNSTTQMKTWLSDHLGYQVDSIDKKAVKEIRKSTEDKTIKDVLQLRAEISKTSVAKYDAVKRSVGKDGRVRGILQFYGANRTGRWAGRILQVQNLPQNHLEDLELARNIVIDGDYDLFSLLFPVSQTLSELIRTMLIPSDGCRFIVVDFSAIEARVIAYLANEHWRLQVFKEGGDIYCASASQMFKVPVVKHGINGHLRQKGKIAELALGYGGSVGALKSMGALEMGLKEEELQGLVDVWRATNPHITDLWRTVQKAAMNAIEGIPSSISCGIQFIKRSGILFVKLPSGRSIAYVKPEIGTNRFGRPSITYMGLNQEHKSWERIETWGGKLVENIVQAFARDCLAESLIRLEERGFSTVFHVHDEVIVEVLKDVSSADEISKIMSEPISWAKGLPLSADGYECEFYKKD